MIGPDATSGGMGEAGAGTEPDANSSHWNPAKYAFIEKDMGFAVSYSPWLKGLGISDINLAYLSGYKRLDEKSAIGASLKFFSLGDITFTDKDGNITAENVRPNEFSIDGTYSRKFSDRLSGAVSARFIYSNLTLGHYVGEQSTKPGTSIAADISIFHRSDLNISGLESARLDWGLNISNIGQKVSYSNDDFQKDFIPTNLRIGPSLHIDIDEYNAFRFSLDLNKLLVPTPPVYATDSLGNPIVDAAGNKEIANEGGLSNEVSVIQGMIQSFYDAPGKKANGTTKFQEELQEIIWVVGVEYWYDKQFAVRAGYFHEAATKGNRKFFTLGAGLRYNVFGLDFSYLIPTDQNNPLANTLRFTLTFDFDAFQKQSN